MFLGCSITLAWPAFLLFRICLQQCNLLVDLGNVLFDDEREFLTKWESIAYCCRYIHWSRQADRQKVFCAWRLEQISIPYSSVVVYLRWANFCSFPAVWLMSLPIAVAVFMNSPLVRTELPLSKRSWCVFRPCDEERIDSTQAWNSCVRSLTVIIDRSASTYCPICFINLSVGGI